MFTRARLRIAVLYASLMVVTLALVAGGIVFISVREARRTDDLELRLRAEGLAARAARGGAADTGQAPNGDDESHGGGEHGLEREGVLTYVLPVVDGRPVRAPGGTIPELPDEQAAAQALATGAGQFHTEEISQGQVRLYSLPVQRNGQAVAVVQVARSRYFVRSALTRLLLAVLGIGAAGLVLSAGAGFWLAGRTLRPIAAAMQRQREFTADASHELRTPLTIIRGNAELLARHPDRPIGEYKDVVEDITAEIERLGRLVTDLLTLARADDHRARLVFEHVDLSATAAALAREFEPLAAAKGLKMRAEIAPDVVVQGDPDRLRQLGVILLDNAVRYTEAGSVTLRLAAEGHSAVLSVSDTGPGIAAEHLPRVFERFYRVDAARAPASRGAGLGLAIARWIAEAHGGRIEATSTPGKGSVFTVRLPTRRSTGPAGAASA